VEFFHFYADKLHHGKEEDILFRTLDDKDLSLKHRGVMEELIEDHKWGRKTVERLEMGGGQS
jgi:hemerythrin-like domain-containing protein